MTITDITGGVEIRLNHLTTDLVNEPNRFARELFLRFDTNPIGFSFTGDPYVQSISVGSLINAGLPFNVKVVFKNSPASRLTQGSNSAFQLFGVSTSDFVGANDSAMIHFQALIGGDSSKVIAPEPASLAALGIGLVGLAGRLRRKR